MFTANVQNYAARNPQQGSQPQAGWTQTQANQLRRPGAYYLPERNSVSIPAQALRGKLASIQQGLRAMNIEGRFTPDGHADLRTSNNDSIHVATWATGVDAQNNDARIEFQRTSGGDGMKVYHDIRNLCGLVDGSKTVEDLAQEYQSTPLRAESAPGLVRLEQYVDRLIAENNPEGIQSPFPQVDIADIIDSELQQSYGTYRALSELALSVDASKMTPSSVVSLAEKVLSHSESAAAQNISAAVRNEIVAFAQAGARGQSLEQSDSDSNDGFNLGNRLPSHGPVLHALDALNKSLEVRAALSETVQGSKPALSDEFLSDRFLSALVSIASSPD